MPIKGFRRFNQQVKKFTKTLLPEKLVLFQKKIALDVLRGVVLKTPVDTGTARGGWQVTLDTGPARAAERKDKYGSLTVNDGMGVIDAVRFGQAIFITNNVSYIKYLEEGTERMKPFKMLALTLEEMKLV